MASDLAVLELVTHRLRLRPWRPDDRDWFVALVTRGDVMEHMDGAHTPGSARGLFARIVSGRTDGGAAAWCVERQGDLIGHAFVAGLSSDRPEVGIIIHPDNQRAGYGAEATRAIVDHALRYVDTIWATVDEANQPSIRLVESLGFVVISHEEDEDGLAWRAYARRSGEPSHDS